MKCRKMGILVGGSLVTLCSLYSLSEMPAHLSETNGQKPIVVITASYNNAQWYERNLDSIFSQSYDNYYLIYIADDAAHDDGTGNLVEQYLIDHHQTERAMLVKNSTRRGHLANQYDAIHQCPDNAIIVIIDGDDWLAHNEVFSRINREYQNGAWLTYGQYWYWNKNRIGICRFIDPDILEQGKIRQLKPWCTSHLRTFYAGLFKRIRYEDLLYENAFFPMCADVATMFPMIDMARTHVHFIDEILLIYNDANTLCFFHDKREQQLKLEKTIRQRPVYPALTHPPY